MEWISVIDRSPTKEGRYRCVTKEGVDEKGEGFFDGKKWSFAPLDSPVKFGMCEGFVTHWKPLIDELPVKEIGDAIYYKSTEHIQINGIRFFGLSWEEIHTILEKHGYVVDLPF